MDYQELLDFLRTLPDDLLLQTLSVYDHEIDEIYPVYVDIFGNLRIIHNDEEQMNYYDLLTFLMDPIYSDLLSQNVLFIGDENYDAVMLPITSIFSTAVETPLDEGNLIFSTQVF